MEQTDIDKINMLAEPLANYLMQIGTPYARVEVTNYAIDIVTTESHTLVSAK